MCAVIFYYLSVPCTLFYAIIIIDNLKNKKNLKNTILFRVLELSSWAPNIAQRPQVLSLKYES